MKKTLGSEMDRDFMRRGAGSWLRENVEVVKKVALVMGLFPDLFSEVVGAGKRTSGAKVRSDAGKPRKKTGKKAAKKRKMSEAGRKAIAEAAKRRWAKHRAEKGS